MSEPKQGGRTLPVIDEMSAPYWSGAREGRVLIQRDPKSGLPQWPPRPFVTPLCLDTPEWIASSGRGAVYTYSVIHRSSYGAPATPYVLAVVALDDGPHVTSNIVDVDPAAVTIGMRVQADFEAVTDGAALIVFKPEERE